MRKRLTIGLLAGLLSAMPFGCTSLNIAPVTPTATREPPPPLPGKRTIRVSQFVFLSDFELSRDLPLFKDLANLREQIHKELQIPVSTAIIQVYLFEDRERYESFMRARYPDLPRRRAFFVASHAPLAAVRICSSTPTGVSECSRTCATS
jgi:hypothetical protein